MNKNECLRQKTGASDCGGCNVLTIIETHPTEPVERITGAYYPAGEQPKLPEKPKPSIW